MLMPDADVSRNPLSPGRPVIWTLLSTCVAVVSPRAAPPAHHPRWWPPAGPAAAPANALRLGDLGRLDGLIQRDAFQRGQFVGERLTAERRPSCSRLLRSCGIARAVTPTTPVAATASRARRPTAGDFGAVPGLPGLGGLMAVGAVLFVAGCTMVMALSSPE